MTLLQGFKSTFCIKLWNHGLWTRRSNSFNRVMGRSWCEWIALDSILQIIRLCTPWAPSADPGDHFEVSLSPCDKLNSKLNLAVKLLWTTKWRQSKTEGLQNAIDCSNAHLIAPNPTQKPTAQPKRWMEVTIFLRFTKEKDHLRGYVSIVRFGRPKIDFSPLDLKLRDILSRLSTFKRHTSRTMTGSVISQQKKKKNWTKPKAMRRSSS